MQKVGINELYKMILEEMDLEEAPNRNQRKRRAAALKKKKQERDNKIKSLGKARETLNQFINTEKNKNIDDKDIKLGLIAFAKSKNLAESTDTTDAEGDAKKVLDDAKSLLASISNDDLLQAMKERGITPDGNEEPTEPAEEEAEEEAQMPAELQRVFQIFQNINNQIADNGTPTMQKLEAAAETQNTDVKTLVIRYDKIKKLEAVERKFPKFMEELTKFAKAYKQAEASKPSEPEEQEVDQELEELKRDLEALRKFTDELTKIKREKGLLSESIIIEEPAEEEPAEQQKLSRSDLEDAAKAAGADYDYFKNLVDKLSKGGLLVKYSEEEEVAAAKEAIGEFQTLSRQTRSDEEVYRDIIASYKAAVAKRKAENPEELDEIEARSKTVIAAMKKAWQSKDEELPDEVQDDAEETLEQYPPELSLDDEMKLVESFIKDAINVALGIDIEMPEPETSEKSEPTTSESKLAGGAIGTIAGAAGGLAWVAALGAAIPFAPIALGAAIGATAGAYIGKRMAMRKKDEKRFLSSIEYGVDTFVKTLAKTYRETDDLNTDNITKLKEKYKDILDANGKLKLNKVDKSSIQRMLSDILKSEGQSAGRGMAQPLEGNVLQGEMGATLKKFAKIILYSNVGKVNESREKDKQAMLKFLKSYKKSRGRDYEAILKSEFNDKERDALVYWFSDKKRGKEFVKTYFKDGADLFDDSAMDTFTGALEDTLGDVGAEEEPPAEELPDKDVELEDEPEEDEFDFSPGEFESSDDPFDAGEESLGSPEDTDVTPMRSRNPSKVPRSSSSRGSSRGRRSSPTSRRSSPRKPGGSRMEEALKPIIIEVIKEILEK